MPIISMFYGIIIRIYLFDNQHHRLPHIHARYAEFEASIGRPMAMYWPASCRESSFAWFRRGSSCIVTN